MITKVPVRLSLIFLLSITLALFFNSCKSEDDGGVDLVSSATSSSSSSYGTTGCRGRSSGVKQGHNNLYLPYPANTTYTVSQTWFGTWSHYFTGREHALDFPIPTNQPIWPVAPGRVIDLKEDSNINCTSNCNDANYVLIDHGIFNGEGFYGKYMHMCQNCVDVNIGDLVDTTTQIGRSGNTGWSTESHLHFEMVDWEENCTVEYGFTYINSGAYTALTNGVSYESSSDTVGTSGYEASPSVITGSVFEKVGVTLTSSIDWYLDSTSDVITVQGSLTSSAVSEGNTGIAIFLVDKSNQLVPGTKEYATGTTFDTTYDVPSVTPGPYFLGISKSSNGSYWWQNPPPVVIY